MARAALEPGENSIKTSKVTEIEGGKWRIRWRIRTLDGKLHSMKTTGETKRLCIERAENKAKELIEASIRSSWKRGDMMLDYVESKAVSRVANADLRNTSKASYLRALRYYAEQVHGLTIGYAIKYSNVESALVSIARAHSYDAARQAKKVVSRYVFDELVKAEVIDGNPIAGIKIDLPRSTKNERTRTVPTAEERRQFVDWLANLDTKGMPTRGHSKNEDRQEIIDLTLTQATGGFRLGEMLTITGEDVTIDGNSVTIHVREWSKTHIGRDCLLLDSRAAEAIKRRVEALPEPQRHIFPAPAKAEVAWDRTNATDALRVFYAWAGEQCGIESIKSTRSHSWRTCLNDEWAAAGVPQNQRAAYLGHSEAVNTQNYTQRVDLGILYSKYR